MYFLDTNIFLRYLTNDDEYKAINCKVVGPIDWSGNDKTTDVGVQRDVNDTIKVGSNPCHRTSPGQTLQGYDDWANLDLNFRDDPNDYADGAQRLDVPQEITFDQIDRVNKSNDYDGDGIPNATDSNPAVPNPPVYLPIITR